MTDAEMLTVLRGEFDLDIPAFRKYNPIDKSMPWFRLNSDWFLDPKFHGLRATEQLLYVKLCALLSSSCGPVVRITTSYLQLRVGYRRSSVQLQLLNLWKKGLISLRTGQYEHTNVRTGRDGMDELRFGGRLGPRYVLPPDDEVVV